MRGTIWLVPSPPAYDVLSETISSLARRWALPSFQPHVTLVGQLDSDREVLEEKTASLAIGASKLVLLLNEVDSRDEYFRALFRVVQPNRELDRLNERARMIFNQVSTVLFEPHLSLAYGNLQPEMKREMVMSLGSVQTLTFEVQELTLVDTGSSLFDWKTVGLFTFG